MIAWQSEAERIIADWEEAQRRRWRREQILLDVLEVAILVILLLLLLALAV